MRISVLVPFGADDTESGHHRRKVWEHIRPLWNVLLRNNFIHEVVVGNDVLTGQVELQGSVFTSNTAVRHQFSVSRALNDAASRATGDAFLLFGADHLPDLHVVHWAVEELARHPWLKLYDRIAYLSEAATRLRLAGHPIDSSEWNHHHAPCPGVLGVRKDVWNFVGGMNEDYEGHGYEDSDLFARLSKEFGATPPAHGLPLHELWHPSSRVISGTDNEARYRRDWGHAHGL